MQLIEIKLELRLHGADATGVSFYDPVETILAPIFSPTVLDAPSHATPIANNHYSVVQGIAAFVEDPLSVVMKVVP